LFYKLIVKLKFDPLQVSYDHFIYKIIIVTLMSLLRVQAALNCYMRSFYLQFLVHAIRKWPFSGTYPLFYSNPWSFYIQIHYMPAYFWSPYLLHVTRSTCTYLNLGKFHIDWLLLESMLQYSKAPSTRYRAESLIQFVSPYF